MDKTTKNEIWLVRHAHSLFNMWDDWHEERLKSSDLTPTEVSFATSVIDKFDSKLVDPILSHIGVSQCIAAQPLINTLPIKYVLVSPIQRTLETAKLLFENHPSLPKIKFIVLPLIREIMANPDDIPCFTLERMKEKYTTLKNFNFDFELVENAENKRLYFLETMPLDVQELVYKETEVLGEENYVEAMLKVMKEKWSRNPQHKKKIESFENGRKRCHAFIEWVTNTFMKEKGLTGKEIMAVSHSVYLSHLIAPEFNDYGKAVCPKIRNAAPFLFDLNNVIPLKN